MRRKILFLICTALAGYVILEIAAFIAFFFLYGEPFSFAKADARRAQALAETIPAPAGNAVDKRALILGLAVHPYLGFVRNVDAEEHAHDPLVMPYGLMAESDPFAAGKDTAI